MRRRGEGRGSVHACVYKCVFMLPSMCEENITTVISLNEERQIMFFYNQWGTLPNVSTEYITPTADSLFVFSGWC